MRPTGVVYTIQRKRLIETTVAIVFTAVTEAAEQGLVTPRSSFNTAGARVEWRNASNT